MAIRNGLERTIFASGGLGRLQMVSKPNIGRWNPYIKIVRLRAICNELKRKISASSGLGRLQMVSKADIGQCANEDVGPQGRGLVGELNKTFIIRWKPLSSRQKPLKHSL